MDRGAWQATVHGVTKESDMTEQLTLTPVSTEAECHHYRTSKLQHGDVFLDSLLHPTILDFVFLCQY